MTDFLAIYEKISGAGFGLLSALALFGSYMGIWFWGKAYRERETDLKAQLAAALAERDAARLDTAKWIEVVLRQKETVTRAVDVAYNSSQSARTSEAHAAAENRG